MLSQDEIKRCQISTFSPKISKPIWEVSCSKGECSKWPATRLTRSQPHKSPLGVNYIISIGPSSTNSCRPGTVSTS